MQTVHIGVSAPYDVLVGPGLLSECGARMREAVGLCRVAIVSDSTVDALCGDPVERSLRDAGYDALRCVFPAGERNKTLATLGGILEFLAETQLSRADVLVALGGGVTGDMAGFAAAVYMRGIRFVQLPTTLLAAVDASVGGKTAVDLAAGKNLAGAFHQPSLVLTDVDVLRALPQTLLSDGAAEIIKHGVLADAELFARMCEPDWTREMETIVARNVAIKCDVVVADERENGARQLLNLGHTFGHAVEKCSGYAMSHGQSVAVGMVIAAGAAGNEDVCRAIIAANRNCGLPVTAPYSAKTLAEAALSDKKRRGGLVTLVLPERIGRCRLEKVEVSRLEEYFQKGISMAEAVS